MKRGFLITNDRMKILTLTGTNTYLDDMKKDFLMKFQPYCRPRDSQGDIFRMMQQGGKIIEDYLERLLYNL